MFVSPLQTRHLHQKDEQKAFEGRQNEAHSMPKVHMIRDEQKYERQRECEHKAN